MNDPIRANCRTNFHAIRHSGTRKLTNIDVIVMHSTQGTTALASARWFTDRRCEGSAHLVVDDTVCYRTLANEQVPWGAKGANHNGFHIEMAGLAIWSLAIWQRHFRTIERAAYKAAFHCHLFGIPPTFITAADLKAGRKGITTHAECTKAFGGDHTDPGRLWPRKRFMDRVNFHYAQIAAQK